MKMLCARFKGLEQEMEEAGDEPSKELQQKMESTTKLIHEHERSPRVDL